MITPDQNGRDAKHQADSAEGATTIGADATQHSPGGSMLGGLAQQLGRGVLQRKLKLRSAQHLQRKQEAEPFASTGIHNKAQVRNDSVGRPEIDIEVGKPHHEHEQNSFEITKPVPTYFGDQDKETGLLLPKGILSPQKVQVNIAEPMKDKKGNHYLLVWAKSGQVGWVDATVFGSLAPEIGRAESADREKGWLPNQATSKERKEGGTWYKFTNAPLPPPWTTVPKEPASPTKKGDGKGKSGASQSSELGRDPFFTPDEMATGPHSKANRVEDYVYEQTEDPVQGAPQGYFNVVLDLPREGIAVVADDIANVDDTFQAFEVKEVPLFAPESPGPHHQMIKHKRPAGWALFRFGYINGDPNRRGWTLSRNLLPASQKPPTSQASGAKSGAKTKTT